MLGGGIFKGMAVTLRNFVGSYFYKERLTTNDYEWRPDGALPQSIGDYPKEEGEQLSDTTTVNHYSRNFPMLLHDTGEPMDTIRCVACQICERECPPQCIYIEKSTEKIENADGKPQFYPAKFDIDVSVCMSCQICVEVCPFDAIVMNSQFELSTPDRFGGLLVRRDDLLKSNDYYHKIHPQEAAARDQKMADDKAAKVAKKKAAAEKAKAAAEAKAASAAEAKASEDKTEDAE
ncbi:MAG TPA: 4Fe-4S dicluster domain-containing protein [Verrucomicrobiales bacterium]|nr:4Fe-4S dicluster domain-containing protein [Verrucomicrobiales bacterium]HIL24143.1 4Fe-4S dicluster domain-containing protein [Verrucomicrobiota bacterium]